MLHAFNFLVHYSLFILVCFILFFLPPFFHSKGFFFFLLSFLFFPSIFPSFLPFFVVILCLFLCVLLLCHAIFYSIFHASPCCLLYPSHFTLLLHVLSLTFYLAITSSLPSCFAMLLPIPSFVLCDVVAYSFLCASPCCCLLPPSHFTLQLPTPSPLFCCLLFHISP